MAESREEWISKRAYALWESEGHPSGKDGAHWEQASSEWHALETSAASSDGSEVKSKVKRAAPKPKAAAASPAPVKKAAAKRASAKTASP